MGRSNAIEKEEKRKKKHATSVAKYVRFNCPNKTFSYKQDEVQYFTATDAIETLLKSKYFSKEKEPASIPKNMRKDTMFYTRQEVIDFLRQLVYQRLALRAIKTYKEQKTQVAQIKELESTEKKDSEATDDNDKVEDKVEESEKKIKKKKRKFKIVLNRNQGFYDGDDEVYVWKWNPTPLKNYIYGAGVLLLVIGGTLFPLWPGQLRTGVYYTSISLAGFIGGILVTALLRTILFGMIWLCTAGRHHLWILPNLVEDVGFFESFKPVYTWDVKSDKDKAEKSPKKLKDKDKKKTDAIEAGTVDSAGGSADEEKADGDSETEGDSEPKKTK